MEKNVLKGYDSGGQQDSPSGAYFDAILGQNEASIRYQTSIQKKSIKIARNKYNPEYTLSNFYYD